MKDVEGDGHCELCTIADLRDMSVDDYQTIHYQLLKKLEGDDSESYL